MRWWLVAVLAGGCDSLFDLDRIPDRTPRDGDATNDAHDPDTRLVDDADPLDAPSNVGCASSYNGGRYQVKSGSFPWTYAQGYCTSLQVAGATRYSHLVVISDPAELATVSQLISVSDSGWIGLSYAGDNWTWSSTETVNSITWAMGQPDQIDVQHCGRIVPNVGIDNEQCSGTLNFICECDEFMAQ